MPNNNKDDVIQGGVSYYWGRLLDGVRSITGIAAAMAPQVVHTASSNLEATTSLLRSGNEIRYSVRLRPIWPQDFIDRHRLSREQIQQLNESFYADQLRIFTGLSDTPFPQGSLADPEATRRSIEILSHDDGSIEFKAKGTLSTDWLARTSDSEAQLEHQKRGLFQYEWGAEALTHSIESVLFDASRKATVYQNFEDIARSFASHFPSRQIPTTNNLVPIFASHPDEATAINMWLQERGITQLTNMANGAETLVLDTNGEFLVRVTQKGGTYVSNEPPKSSAVLQPISATETKHMRVEIVPKVKVQAPTQQQFAALQNRLLLEKPPLTIWDGTNHVGVLPDGTAVVIDYGSLKVTEPPDLAKLAQIKAELAQSGFGWEAADGTPNQHRFFGGLLAIENEGDRAVALKQRMQGYAAQPKMSFADWLVGQRGSIEPVVLAQVHAAFESQRAMARGQTEVAHGENYKFPGPAMDTTVDEAATAQALERMKAAQARGGGIAEADAQHLIRWVTNNARTAVKELGNTVNCPGSCGPSQSVATVTLEKMGFKPNIIRNVLIQNGMQHAITTVTIPVEVPGQGVVQKTYLIDPSFRQFMGGEAKGSLTHADIHGERLTSTPAGAQLANEILSQGYAELTPARAKLYLDALSKNGGPLFSTVDEYMRTITQSNTQLDVTRAEVAEDVREGRVKAGLPGEPDNYKGPHKGPLDVVSKQAPHEVVAAWRARLGPYVSNVRFVEGGTGVIVDIPHEVYHLSRDLEDKVGIDRDATRGRNLEITSAVGRKTTTGMIEVLIPIDVLPDDLKPHLAAAAQVAPKDVDIKAPVVAAEGVPDKAKSVASVWERFRTGLDLHGFKSGAVNFAGALSLPHLYSEIFDEGESQTRKDLKAGGVLAFAGVSYTAADGVNAVGSTAAGVAELTKATGVLSETGKGLRVANGIVKVGGTVAIPLIVAAGLADMTAGIVEGNDKRRDKAAGRTVGGLFGVALAGTLGAGPIVGAGLGIAYMLGGEGIAEMIHSTNFRASKEQVERFIASIPQDDNSIQALAKVNPQLAQLAQIGLDAQRMKALAERTPEKDPFYIQHMQSYKSLQSMFRQGMENFLRNSNDPDPSLIQKRLDTYVAQMQGATEMQFGKFYASLPMLDKTQIDAMVDPALVARESAGQLSAKELQTLQAQRGMQDVARKAQSLNAFYAENIQPLVAAKAEIPEALRTQLEAQRLELAQAAAPFVVGKPDYQFTKPQSFSWLGTGNRGDYIRSVAPLEQSLDALEAARARWNPSADQIASFGALLPSDPALIAALPAADIKALAEKQVALRTLEAKEGRSPLEDQQLQTMREEWAKTVTARMQKSDGWAVEIPVAVQVATDNMEQARIKALQAIAPAGIVVVAEPKVAKAGGELAVASNLKLSSLEPDTAKHGLKDDVAKAKPDEPQKARA